nr:4Fe-4S cluster-binding domain-containing protein [uncultured Rhodoferax sp.]
MNKPIEFPLKQVSINKAFEAIAKSEGLLPIKVTPFYRRLIDEEVSALGHNLGPLHRAVYPTQERLEVRAPNEVKDFVDDRANSQESSTSHFIIKKYHERILFMPTSDCVGNCQYCFRTDVLSENSDVITDLNYQVSTLVEFLNNNSEVSEVILSGGDPLVLPFSKISHIIESIKTKTSVKSIRIHTRSIIYGPNSFTAEKIQLFAKHNVRIVFHIIHPYEICDEVSAKIKELRSAGLRLYNQFPLLRNTNDHADVLLALLKTLDEHGVRNLSIFIPDPINYSASFRVRLSRVFSIIDALNWKSPSWINSTRVLFDSQYGKARREDLHHVDSDLDIAYFKRGEKMIPFPDLPVHLDTPGSLDTMLWKQRSVAVPGILTAEKSPLSEPTCAVG